MSVNFKDFFGETNETFTVEFEKVIEVEKTDEYVGPTTVIPTVENQVLETKDLILRENVVVTEIPYETVDNDFGGYTVTIAMY